MEWFLSLRSHSTSFVARFDFNEDILHFAGELHASVRPGSIWFTSIQQQDLFTSLVLDTLSVDPVILEFATILSQRMAEKCGGRREYQCTLALDPIGVIVDPLTPVLRMDGRSF